MTLQTPDDRPPLTIALEWSTRLMAIGLEMSLPAAAGFWFDRRLGISPVLLILGAIVGFAASMWHLLQIVRQQEPQRPK